MISKTGSENAVKCRRRTAALNVPQNRYARLKLGPFFNLVCENLTDPAQPDMTKRIKLFFLSHIIPFKFNAFRNRNNAEGSAAGMAFFNNIANLINIDHHF